MFMKIIKKIKKAIIKFVYSRYMKKFLKRGETSDVELKTHHFFKDLENDVHDREDFILNISKGKNVLHFGFLDSPFLAQKIKDKNLLHCKIKEVASNLHGIDINSRDLEEYRLITGDSENSIFDVSKNDINIDSYCQKYDLIILGEVLEHIENPGLALRNIRRICRKNEGCKVCITVPNAFSANGQAAACLGIEAVHPGHYFYFSPYTIKKILEDTGFEDIRLHMYSNPNSIISSGITKSGIVAVAK